ncbi:hypothetical protein [Chitinophaga sancti]|uniref:hypothetical protein n=1 Tax=Chitinophaga sancti TaxID=1004 RepID=UPI003F78F89B
MKRMLLTGLLAVLFTTEDASAQFGKLVEKARSGADKAKEIKSNANTTTSTVNKKMGQVNIYFSKTRFGEGTTGASSDFTEGDYIYGRIVFPKPLKEYVSDNTITFDVAHKEADDDDYNVNQVKIDVTKANQEANQLDFDVLADPKQATTLYADHLQAPSLIVMVMQYIQPGVKTEFNWKVEGLEGTFYLTTKNTQSFAAFVAPIQQKANSFAQNDDAMKADLPEEFDQPSHAFADPQLSKANILKYLPANIEVLKFVVGPGDDYKVMKNALGVILYKQTDRYIMVAYKDKKTGNCYYDNVIFERPYEGNGKYGSLKVRTNGERIDCSKIK